eukprot:g6134.t1
MAEMNSPRGVGFTSIEVESLILEAFFGDETTFSEAILSTKDIDYFNRRFYRVLKTEANRIGCHIADVMPHLELQQIEAETNGLKFANLNHDLFRKVVQNMELIDFVRMGCVCKNWRLLVQNNAKEIEKMEYCKTTHFLRFPRLWTNPCSLSSSLFTEKWISTSKKLMSWVVQNSMNLQILIIDWCIAWEDFTAVVDQCPFLKHLICSVDDERFLQKLPIKRKELLLKLESFVLCTKCITCSERFVAPSREFHRELTIYSVTSTEPFLFHIMDTTDDLLVTKSLPKQQFFKLKYLRLNFSVSCILDEESSLPESLQNCPELLVLILEDTVMTGKRVLNSLRFCLKLQVLWIVNNHISDSFEFEHLKNLHTALVHANSNRSFTEFHIVVLKSEIDELMNAAPFNFIVECYESIVPERLAVRSPYMRSILNTPF